MKSAENLLRGTKRNDVQSFIPVCRAIGTHECTGHHMSLHMKLLSPIVFPAKCQLILKERTYKFKMPLMKKNKMMIPSYNRTRD